jgi:hypothetical protein
MCSAEPAAAAAAATAAAAARLRWRREAGWDPRFLLLVLEVLLAVALVVVVASCGTGAALLSGGRSVLAALFSAASPNQVIKINAYAYNAENRECITFINLIVDRLPALYNFNLCEM